MLLRVSEQRNILHEIRKRKANWIGHILRRNCLLKQVIEGKIKGEMEVTRRRWRRRKKLLDDLKDRRGYPHLKEEALDRTMWRNRFGRGFGPVVRQNTEWMISYYTGQRQRRCSCYLTHAKSKEQGWFIHFCNTDDSLYHFYNKKALVYINSDCALSKYCSRVWHVKYILCQLA